MFVMFPLWIFYLLDVLFCSRRWRTLFRFTDQWSCWLWTWSVFSWFISRAPRFWFHFSRFRLFTPWFVLTQVCWLTCVIILQRTSLSELLFRSGFPEVHPILRFGFTPWIISFKVFAGSSPFTLSRCSHFAAFFGGLWSKRYTCHDFVCTTYILNLFHHFTSVCTSFCVGFVGFPVFIIS